MLTRLRVNGFKNLVGVDVRLGPFTCIAGANGVGKSNLFDAILLLSALADGLLLEAATRVRGETTSANAGRIFTTSSGTRMREMTLEADMIVPASCRDDLDQEARATTTALTYGVTLRLVEEVGRAVPRLELVSEKLDYHTRTAARKQLAFARGKSEWLDSVLLGRRTSPFISTDPVADGTLIKVHEDSGHQGRTRGLRADTLSRTVLSTINTAEHPTALAARREMQSWRLLQLEPTHLRAPSELQAAPRLDPDGRGVAATLHRLLTRPGADPDQVRTRLVNRLAELIDDVADVRVDRDEQRELLTILARDRDGTELRARDLSDGTLRFLALAVLELDPSWGGVLCMEEPENGIHPTRVEAMLQLLRDIAMSVDHPVDAEDNPLRQVIVNTHSPQLVSLVPASEILFAEPCRQEIDGGSVVRGVTFRPLAHTWRDESAVETVTKGRILEYLSAARAALHARGAADDPPLGRRPEAQLAFGFPEG